MRILLLTALSFSFSLNIFSQSWVDSGIKFGVGVTQLVNTNIWEEQTIVNKLSPGYSFGGKLGLNFNLNHQITLDFIYTKASQEFEFQPTATEKSWAKNIKYNSFNIPFLYKHNSDNGSFLEIGPQISFMTGVTETVNGTTTKVDDYFTNTHFEGVVGVGSFMLGSNNTYLVFGIRVHYAFQDLLTTEGGKGEETALPYPINNGEMDYQAEPISFDEYKPLNAISAIAYLEINYDLAYLVRSNCKRTAIKFF
ncbi:hypothetical protein N8089_00280 [Flavobacteriales bacterium]|jgi:hypothetical protein|nr:hypothetical protein [Flavobacteriales bacterium]